MLVLDASQESGKDDLSYLQRVSRLTISPGLALRRRL